MIIQCVDHIVDDYNGSLLLRKHQERVPRYDRESKEGMGSGRTEAQEP